MLRRFGLILVIDKTISLNDEILGGYDKPAEAVWSLAKDEPSLRRCIEILEKSQDISAKALAESISEEFHMNWSEGSKIRNGGILRQWSRWVKEGMESSDIPNPPGRSNNLLNPIEQLNIS